MDLYQGLCFFFIFAINKRIDYGAVSYTHLCYRRIVAVFRIDELACGTTGPPVVQVVGIHAAQSHVHGRERAHGDVVGRDFVHGAVVGILRRDAHCGTFSQYLDKRRTPHVTPLQVSHEIEIQRLVAHGTEPVSYTQLGNGSGV